MFIGAKQAMLVSSNIWTFVDVLDVLGKCASSLDILAPWTSHILRTQRLIHHMHVSLNCVGNLEQNGFPFFLASP